MSNNKKYTVLGIMSGTSMDGLDCSLIETDGKKYCKIISENSYDYSIKYQNKLKKIIINLPKYKKEQINYIKKNENLINEEMIRIIKKFINSTKYNKKNINFIGLSGQTIVHNPKKKYSLQLGSAEKIFNKIKIPIVYNFREKDIYFGGHGAPIGCFYHKLILQKINKQAAIINIGGVSNITFLEKNRIIGFDLGPGNALIDDLTYHFYKKKYDKNGIYAKKGILIKKIYNKIKENNFFREKYPKSLDRNHFKIILDSLKNYDSNDAIRTASLITVFSIINGLNLINKKIKLIILTGGGRKNNFIFDNLKKILNKDSINLKNIDEYGFNGDMIEAQMFGYLAIRCIKKLAISTPSITGVKKTISGGRIYKKN